MQHNVFFVELIGDEPLSGVTIPVIIDTKNRLSDSKMADIAKILNNFRIVFVKAEGKDTLETRVFSVHGEISDCLYSNVATVYSLTELSFIRKLELGARELTLIEKDTRHKVLISYEDNEVLSVEHKLPLYNLLIKKTVKTPEYLAECVQEQHSCGCTKIIHVEDPLIFSKIRKDDDFFTGGDQDHTVIYYDQDIQTVFFCIKRTAQTKDTRVDSRAQISIMTRYLMDRGIDNIQSFTHVLNTGQYAVLRSKVQDDSVTITMDSRILVEGIINL